MDKEFNDVLSDMMSDFDFTESEKKFIERSNQAQTAVSNFTRTFASMILAKQIIRSTATIARSNEKLAEAEGENSMRMQYLTIAIVSLTVVQVLLLGIQLFIALVRIQ